MNGLTRNIDIDEVYKEMIFPVFGSQEIDLTTEEFEFLTEDTRDPHFAILTKMNMAVRMGLFPMYTEVYTELRDLLSAETSFTEPGKQFDFQYDRNKMIDFQYIDFREKQKQMYHVMYLLDKGLVISTKLALPARTDEDVEKVSWSELVINGKSYNVEDADEDFRHKFSDMMHQHPFNPS